MARRFKCCIILCDLAWLDPDMKVSNGISATEQRDMLRLDAMIMMVQMNIRKLINVRHLPAQGDAVLAVHAACKQLAVLCCAVPCVAMFARCCQHCEAHSPSVAASRC